MIIGARKSLYRNWENIVDEVNMKYTDILRLHHPEPEINKHSADDQQINDINPLLAEMNLIPASPPV